MAWKNQGGVKNNVKVANLNSSGGAWSFVDGYFYHKNKLAGTSVGIGTTQPFSRLSFGDHEKLRIEESTNFKEPILAFSEDNNGLKGSGIGYYFNRDQRNFPFTHGLKFICSNSDQKISLEDENVKLYITNNGRFFFNKAPTDATNSTIDVQGGLALTGSMVIGNDTTTTVVGTIKFEKSLTGGYGKLLIKDKEEGTWSVIKSERAGALDTNWKANEQGQIFYDTNSVTIGQRANFNSKLSIQGDVVIGNAELLKKVFNHSTSSEGSLIVGKHIMIADETTNININESIMLSLGSKRDKSFIIGGPTTSINGNYNVSLGSNVAVNGNYSYGFGDNIKLYNSEHSFGLGKNITIGSTSKTSIGSYNLIVGKDNTALCNETFIMGEGNSCNSNESVLMGGTNIIKSSIAVTNMICGNGNAIRDIDTSVENSKSSGYILGNNNLILSQTGKTEFDKDINAYILGESNKALATKNLQSTIIFGDSNEVKSSAYIIGNNIVHDLSGNNNQIEPEIGIVIGSNIDNSYPWSHAGVRDYNRIDLSKKWSTTADKPHIDKQPGLLMVVGQGKSNKSFDPTAGTFSVDLSGTVRCTNIISNKPNTGLVRCNTLDAKTYKYNGFTIPGFTEYSLTFEVDTLNRTGILNIYPLDNKVFPVPYPSKIKKIISSLDMPNITFDVTTAASDVVLKVINDKTGADKKETTITHPLIPPPARPNPDSAVPPPVWDRWSQITADQPKRWPTLDDNAAQAIVPTDNILVDNRVQIQVTAGQTGFSTAAFTGLIKAKILIVFEKI